MLPSLFLLLGNTGIYIYIYFPLLSWRHKPVKMISWTSGILAITVASYPGSRGGEIESHGTRLAITLACNYFQYAGLQSSD